MTVKELFKLSDKLNSDVIIEATATGPEIKFER